jgi:hypothetical protein
LDFNDLSSNHDIDSCYVYNAQKTIDNWFKSTNVKRSKIEEVLFDLYDKDSNQPQVKFIWYAVQNQSDLSSIKTFNNLNKGKISLTNAELIKALFVLESKKESLNLNEFALEWNEIENALHDDRFWLFLSNKNYNPATRIDLIFDFLTGKGKDDDDDFSYRQFQALYDGVSCACWTDMDINNFIEAWKEVKSVYQLFVYWYEYEDKTSGYILYHYIGYLISIGVSHKEIYERIKTLSKNKMADEIKVLIREKVNIKDIDTLSFDKKEPIRKILLLFNIESCVKMSGYRFPFDRYKEESWDIEHIASQTDNTLQTAENKIEWLSYLDNIVCDHKDWSALKEQGTVLKKNLNDTGKDEGEKFKSLYQQIVAIVEPEDENAIEDKDSLLNLTLLDSVMNRSYGNALFPTKRQRIIDGDKNGKFIPPCTKNIFLKYYTLDSADNSQWKNAWKQTDGDAYLKEIHSTIDKFLK